MRKVPETYLATPGGSPVLQNRAVEALDGGDGFGATATPAETQLLDELLLATAADDGSTSAVPGGRALVDVVDGADVGVKVKMGSWSSAQEWYVAWPLSLVPGEEGGCLGFFG